MKPKKVIIPIWTFQMAIPMSKKEENLLKEGLRVFIPEYSFNITQNEQDEIRQFLGDIYNGGIKVTMEVFSALIQDAVDLEEIRARMEDAYNWPDC